ncbi:MAG TPA: HDOD domain-containing protein, partial [Chloroflexi bacterium]|nr:HDOD domain-containing protein [Chloroflexota bacterium]
VALAAREIAKVCCAVQPEEFFVAGLLHDVGKLVFDTQFPDQFSQSIGLLNRNPDLATVDAELQCLGVPHTVAGSMLALAWRLPPDITEVILNHHRPLQSHFACELCTVVHVADGVCNRMGLGCRHLPDFDVFGGTAAWSLQLAPCTLRLAIERFEQQLAADKALLGTV